MTEELVADDLADSVADATLVAYLRALRADPGPAARDVGAVGLRADSRARVALRELGPGLPHVENLSIPGDPPVQARFYRPAGQALPLVVYLHGGGWTFGDLDSHDRPCRRLAVSAEVAVLALDYRRAPEDPWPAAVDDAVVALQWAAANRAQLGVGTILAVAGDSAGGNLAALACLRLRALGSDILAAQLLLYPNTDLSLSSLSVEEKATGWGLAADDAQWFAEQFVPDRRMRSDPLVSPLFEPDLSSLPPALIITVEHDPLRDEGDAYAAALGGAGVTVTHRCEQGMVHGFLGMDLVSPAAAAAGERFFDDVRRLLHPPRSVAKGPPPGPVVVAREEAGPVTDYPDLEQELGDLWIRVTRAGGAVGFLPDGDEADIRAAATEVVESIRAGSSHAIGFSRDGLLAGIGFLIPQRATVVRHRADVVRVMIAPEFQRQGLGAGLLAALVQRARTLGLTTLLLSARGGTGAPQFYLSQGWTQWGVIPGSLRLSDDDWRDDVQFLLQL